MLTQDQIETISRATVISSAGDKIGKVGQVYVDDQTGEPAWVSVNTGLFGTSESFAPLRGANLEGDDLRVGYSKDEVKNAPRVDADGHLSEEDEDTLYTYYATDQDTSATVGQLTPELPEDRADSDRTSPPVDGGSGDGSMTRSEERLHVGTENREAGRARLRKYVVTDTETVTVPVTHEEVRVEREPIMDANRDDALSGPELTESEHEVVLTEERPVVEKETVPVEKVRLETETVTEEAQVTEDVRREQIEMEGTTEGTDRH